jgi:hypothetical protein
LSDISENKSEDDGANTVENNNNLKVERRNKIVNSDSSDGEEVNNAYHGDIFEMKSSTTTGSDEEKEGRTLSSPELQSRVHSFVEQFRKKHDQTVNEIIATNPIEVEDIQPEKCKTRIFD